MWNKKDQILRLEDINFVDFSQPDDLAFLREAGSQASEIKILGQPRVPGIVLQGSMVEARILQHNLYPRERLLQELFLHEQGLKEARREQRLSEQCLRAQSLRVQCFRIQRPRVQRPRVQHLQVQYLRSQRLRSQRLRHQPGLFRRPFVPKWELQSLNPNRDPY
ncbi:unnamed protein product [Penicillium manginii]